MSSAGVSVPARAASVSRANSARQRLGVRARARPGRPGRPARARSARRTPGAPRSSRTTSLASMSTVELSSGKRARAAVQIRASRASREIFGPPGGVHRRPRAQSSVASASTQQVASGISRRLRDELVGDGAADARAAGCGSPCVRRGGVGRAGVTAREVGRRAGARRLAAARSAYSTSARRISPSGPEPVSSRRSRPFSPGEPAHQRRDHGDRARSAATAAAADAAAWRRGRGPREPGPRPAAAARGAARAAPAAAARRRRRCRSRPARCRSPLSRRPRHAPSPRRRLGGRTSPDRPPRPSAAARPTGSSVPSSPKRAVTTPP